MDCRTETFHCHSQYLSSQAIARANQEVQEAINSEAEGKKHGLYIGYSPEERVKISQYMSYHGIAVAAQ